MELDSITLRVIVVVALFCLRHNVTVRAITDLRMEDNCDQEISILTRFLPGQGRLVLSTKRRFRSPYVSYNNNDSVCDTRIKTWYQPPKIMLYFQHISLKCSLGYLQFFDGKKDSISYPTRIPGIPEKLCGSNMPSGVFTTETRYLRVRYVTKQRASWTDVVKIVFTSYRDGTCTNYDYECANGRCINEDLACNGFNSCGDNSSCRLSKGAIAGIVIGCLVGVAAFVACIIWSRCIKSLPAQPSTTQQTETTQQPENTHPGHYMHPQTSMVPKQPLVPGQYPTQAQYEYSVIPQCPAPYGNPEQGVTQYGAPPQGSAQYNGVPSQGSAQYGVTPTAPQYGAPSPGMAPYQTPDPASPPPAYNTLFSEQEHTKLIHESKASAPPID